MGFKVKQGLEVLLEFRDNRTFRVKQAFKV
jgi:hypothetical protein